MSYEIVRLSKDRLPDLARLMQAVYGSALSMEDMLTKYDTSDFGASYIGYLAYPRNEKLAAAYYGVFPLRLRIGSTIRLGAQSGDTVTHPDHRGKGLFVELAQRTYELAREGGIEFVYGFPNEASYPGFARRLNWVFPYEMQSINFFSYNIPFSKVIKGWGSLEKFHRRAFDKALSFFFVLSDEMTPFSSITSARQSGVERDAAFMRYKQGTCTVACWGTIRFYLKYDGDIVVGDITGLEDEAALRGALVRLRLAAFAAGIARIKLYCSPGTTLHDVTMKWGWQKKSLPYGYVSFVEGLPLDELKFTAIDYDTF